MELISQILGKYTAYFLINSREYVAYFVCVVLLSWYKHRRSLYPLRLLACLIVGILLCVPIGIIRTEWNNMGGKIFCGTLVTLLVLPMLVFLYRESAIEYALCLTGVIAAKGISGNLFALLLNACGKDDMITMSFFETSPGFFVDWLICLLINAFFQAFIYLFLRKQEKNSNALPGVKETAVLAATAYLLNNVIYSVVHTYQEGNLALGICCKLLFVIIYFAILMVRTGMFSRSVTEAKLTVTEQLLAAEKKHYSEVKDNVDIINMRCHDIKRQLSALQGKLTDKELETLKNAVEIYDSSIKTGSDILDLVLYQKQMYCKKHGITFNTVADGKILGFINSSDLYAVLANAVENAVEATEILPFDKRVISLNVRRQGDDAVIETANYRDRTEIITQNTSKPDKQHHGYGIMSMRYIAEMYGGKVETSAEDDMFFLKITIPIKK